MTIIHYLYGLHQIEFWDTFDLIFRIVWGKEMDNFSGIQPWKTNTTTHPKPGNKLKYHENFYFFYLLNMFYDSQLNLGGTSIYSNLLDYFLESMDKFWTFRRFLWFSPKHWDVPTGSEQNSAPASPRRSRTCDRPPRRARWGRWLFASNVSVMGT